MAVEALGSPQTLVVCGLVATKGRAEEEILPHLGLKAVSREVCVVTVHGAEGHQVLREVG